MNSNRPITTAPLDDAALRVLAGKASHVEVLLGHALLPPCPQTPDALDRAIARWRRLPQSNRAPRHELAQGVGYVLGEYIRARASFEWRLVIDQHGPGPALVHADVTDDDFLMLAPVDSVAKRLGTLLEPGEPDGFVREFVENLCDVLARFARPG
jgi:hypothetical protein